MGVQAQLQKAVPNSFTEIFERDFPYYLSIGMTYELYWYGDVWLTKAYREANRLRMQQANSNFHLQGAYFYEALLDASPILHAFAPKGTKPIEYTSKPYPMPWERKKTTKEEKKQTKEKEAMLSKMYLNQMMRQMGNRFGKAKDETKTATEKTDAPKE